MDSLVKILLSEEKKMSQLTIRYNELKLNIENETADDKQARSSLRTDIAAIKKTNSVIVSHYLKERPLSPEEINGIVNAHQGK